MFSKEHPCFPTHNTGQPGLFGWPCCDESNSTRPAIPALLQRQLCGPGPTPSNAFTCCSGRVGSVGLISAAELFLQIQFEHANQAGNCFGGLQSCGAVAGYQRTYPKANPALVDGPADDTWNMQMPQIALRLPPLAVDPASDCILPSQLCTYCSCSISAIFGARL